VVKHDGGWGVRGRRDGICEGMLLPSESHLKQVSNIKGTVSKDGG
jgi:hypothetical protein